jgi:hypothetical protein
MRIEGTIVDGRSDSLPIRPPIDIPLVGQDRAGDLSVVPLARSVAADKNAAAAVLFVNSRGGSSTASEAMRQSLELIAKRKPLVIAMARRVIGTWFDPRPVDRGAAVSTGSTSLYRQARHQRPVLEAGSTARRLPLRTSRLEGDDDPFTDEERTSQGRLVAYELFSNRSVRRAR